MKNIGRYQIIRRLGKGGMGSVYKGIVPVIDKVVAIKLLNPSEILFDIVGEEKLREIFTFEARTMAGFHQPFLVTAYDFAEDEQGRPFFVMEYICNNLGDMIGEDFQVEKPSRVIHPEKVLHYGRQILQALSFLHHQHIIHRDIKPQNILVTDEDAIKICDFGMALVDGLAFSGPASMQIGSPYYTPPEQRKNPQQVDGRADLYSAAVLLYRMLTGQLPGMQSFALAQVNPIYDQSWDAFFATALSWNPDDRFQSAREMLHHFDTLQIHEKDPQGEIKPHPVKSTAAKTRPRAEPVNICSSRARDIFAVNEQYRSLFAVDNCFQFREGMLVDEATGLGWHPLETQYPVNWLGASQYIEELNQREKRKPIWRLPTINELLTMLDGQGRQTLPERYAGEAKSVWSCDRHGHHEAWYVNVDIGFVGRQDHGCLHHLRAVCTL